MVDVHVVQGLLTTPYILRTHGKGKVVGEKESLSGGKQRFSIAVHEANTAVQGTQYSICDPLRCCGGCYGILRLMQHNHNINISNFFDEATP